MLLQPAESNPTDETLDAKTFRYAQTLNLAFPHRASLRRVHDAIRALPPDTHPRPAAMLADLCSSLPPDHPARVLFE